ncbi:MAG: hypothetical protein WD069_10355 [Planctomycetales bacterium]
MRSISIATGWDAAQRKAGKDPMAAFDASLFHNMRNNFGQPLDGAGTYQSNMLGQLLLNNDEYFRRVYTYTKEGLLDQLADEQVPAAERVEHLFLATVSRRPKPSEAELFAKHLASSPKQRETAEEALWVLITSGEFRFNH